MADLKTFAENENVLSLFQKAIQNNNLYELLLTIQDKEKRQMLFDELNENDKQRILLAATFDTFKDEVKAKARAAAYTKNKDGGSDFDNDIKDFLAVKTERTAKLYKYNLHFFTDWIYEKELNPIALDYKDADNFLIYVKSLDLSAKTKANIAAATSSFFDFLTRRRNIGNPFKKSDVKMGSKTAKKNIEIPNEKEIDVILNYIENHNNKYLPIFRMIIKYGLRAGAFELAKVYKLNNPRKIIFQTTTKGKIFEIELSADDYKILKNVTFADFTPKNIETAFYRIIRKMHKEKLVNCLYSVHDLRHFFAITEYQKNKDIYALKTKLNHSSISTTEIYLRSLKII